MIVCSCNVLSDRDVRACVKSLGCVPRNTRTVYSGLGCSPKCGECAPTIRRMLREIEVQTRCSETAETTSYPVLDVCAA